MWNNIINYTFLLRTKYIPQFNIKYIPILPRQYFTFITVSLLLLSFHLFASVVRILSHIFKSTVNLSIRFNENKLTNLKPDYMLFLSHKLSRLHYIFSVTSKAHCIYIYIYWVSVSGMVRVLWV